MIRIEYLLLGENKIRVMEISDEEYFDLDEDEILTIDTVPKYTQPYQYISQDTSKIIFLDLKIKIGEESIQFKQSFWNEGQNMLTERIDKGKNEYHELIISSCIDKEHRKDETIRLIFDKDKIFPVHHSFITRTTDGVEKMVTIDTTTFRNIHFNKIK